MPGTCVPFNVKQLLRHTAEAVVARSSWGRVRQFDELRYFAEWIDNLRNLCLYTVLVFEIIILWDF